MMRPWDLEDCEVAIFTLKEQVMILESLVYELQNRVEILESETVSA